nr:type I polyketide synthase [Micromonospora wenchangensis]
MARGGISGLTRDHALALLDAAIGRPEPVLAPVRLDLTALTRDPAAVPPVLRGLLPTPVRVRRSAATGTDTTGLADRLGTLAPADREHHVLALVRSHAAAVLGHDSAEAVDAHRAFKDVGFDSLTAVELRNRLTAATGLRLPATLVFDHPTPTAVAAYVLREIVGDEPAASLPPAVPATPDTAADPIVIVGMSCRFPGGVDSPEKLWELLDSGGDAVGPFPVDRGWDLERIYHPDPAHPGTSYTRHGAFLNGVADFDPGFFGISPREALAMDPQQRLLLETSWEVFENAGIDPASLRGSRTGVFAGASGQDYTTLLARIPDHVKGHLVTGNTGSVLSGRISYTFGLEGPAVTVDTACSSSLVALHLAAQSLRQGECTLALAGGATVMSTPGFFVEFSRQQGLARDGRCKAFSADADGMGAAEGAAMVLLERLSDARRHGHRVLAVIRGSAVNQDGASNGLTAPNGPSQQRVIRQALAGAGLHPADIDAVEAHGTGTRLGDPIEAQALIATYGQDRTRPVRIGSVKSNIGHTQAAAGVAGVIKMVLAMRHGVLPRTLHAEVPSPHVDWSAGHVELLHRAEPWEPGDRPRRAGVSSFGISGTNAHLILEQSPDEPEPTTGPAAPRPATTGQHAPLLAWLLSAKTPEALAGQADRLSTTDEPAPDIAHSLLVTRSQFDHRAVVLGRDRADLHAGLDALRAGRRAPNLVRGVRRDGKLALGFAGQGAQRPGMGRELADAVPAFGAALDDVCAVFDRYLDRPLREVIDGDPDRLDQTGHTQPALVAIEIALARLLDSFGIRPALLIGHSIGEFTAAHVAGVLSIEDTAALVCARGRLMQALPAGGAMMALNVTEDEAAAAIEAVGATARWADRIGIAAVNGPSSVVVSGDHDAVLAVADRFDGRRRKLLRTSHAFHSPLMRPILDEFRAVAAAVTYAPATVALVSTLTGRPATGDDLRSADYWVRHAVAPVRFLDGVRTLADLGVTALLELGPDGTLTSMARDVLPDPAVLEPTMRPDRPADETLLTALARLHVHGTPVDWTPVVRDGRRVTLPTYAFQHRRLWLTDTPAHQGIEMGEPLTIAGDGVVFTVSSTADDDFDAPGGLVVELLLRAGDEVDADLIEEVEIPVPPVAVPGGTRMQVRVHAADPAGRRAATVSSYTGDGWTVNATAILASTEPAGPDDAPWAAGQWPPAGAQPVETDGDAALHAVWRDGDALLAELVLPTPTRAAGYLLHPALLEALAAVTGVTGPATVARCRDVRLFATGAHHLRVRLTATPDGAHRLLATDDTGDPVLSVGLVGYDRPGPAATPTRSDPTPRAARRVARRVVRPATAADGGRPGPAALDAADRAGALLDLVRQEAAEVLGHDLSTALDDGLSLLELGFDSLTATELRRRLVTATGVPLAPTVMFDEPSLSALARHLADRVAGTTQDTAGTVSALYWQACAQGRLTEALTLVQAAARLRPAFDVATATRHVPAPVRLTADGADAGTLRVLCLPSFSAVAGPHEFAPFAAALRGSRAVSALPEPGYLDGEALPESLDALLRMQAEAVRREAGTTGFVLVGRSMSGMLAHALTAHLEAAGLPPAAVVLLDSSSPAAIRRKPWLSTSLAQAVADRESGLELRNDTRITAMGRYHEIFGAWEPKPVSTPTLLVRATEPWSAEVATAPGGWTAEWEPPHATVDVPGDHFTILEAAAASTALAVDGWIGATLEARR